MFAILAIVCCAVLASPVTAMSPGDYQVTLQADGVEREYRLHLPPCYDGCTPRPIILAFHGMSANAKLLQRLIKLDETADKYGFITVYPNGTGWGPLKGFQAGATTSEREKRKPDDVVFVHTILNHLQRTVCIDDSRVYATGLSNGAMMCYRLAVEMPNRIAAIAPVSGTLGTEVSLPKCPVSVMHFHGTCDKVLPYDGPREGGLFPQSYHPVPATIELFARAADCQGLAEFQALPNRVDDGTTVCLQSHRNVETGVEVILVKIVGGGHQWPMHKIPLRYLGDVTEEIDANEMMCCFFQRHTVAACGSTCTQTGVSPAYESTTCDSLIEAEICQLDSCHDLQILPVKEVTFGLESDSF
jgi:polyhydroxybutyrate depolymerase